MNLKQYLITLSIVLPLFIMGGIITYTSIEGWSYLDSTYFTIITITTVGYGDLAPQTEIGKIITIVYSLAGTIFLFHIISLISHTILIKKYFKDK